MRFGRSVFIQNSPFPDLEHLGCYGHSDSNKGTFLCWASYWLETDHVFLPMFILLSDRPMDLILLLLNPAWIAGFNKLTSNFQQLEARDSDPISRSLKLYILSVIGNECWNVLWFGICTIWQRAEFIPSKEVLTWVFACVLQPKLFWNRTGFAFRVPGLFFARLDLKLTWGLLG